MRTNPISTGRELQAQLEKLHGDSFEGCTLCHPTFDWWLGALQVGIVVVPLGGDAAAARQPNTAPPRMTVKRAEKIRALHNGGKGHSVNTLWRMFKTNPRVVEDILAGRSYTPIKA